MILVCVPPHPLLVTLQPFTISGLSPWVPMVATTGTHQMYTYLPYKIRLSLPKNMGIPLLAGSPKSPVNYHDSPEPLRFCLFTRRDCWGSTALLRQCSSYRSHLTTISGTLSAATNCARKYKVFLLFAVGGRRSCKSVPSIFRVSEGNLNFHTRIFRPVELPCSPHAWPRRKVHATKDRSTIDILWQLLKSKSTSCSTLLYS